jgi:sigma-B regulation protein RsbU (phosphoserine phosphatase)
VASAGTALPVDPARHTGPIRHVLVVDDSRLQRRILVGILSRWGYDVAEAASGVEALEHCRQRRPDLIVSDWMMPGMNGLEFCRRFRDRAEEDYSYFILLTSKGEKDEIVQGFQAGVDDFLTKPVNADELRARIAAGSRILAMQKELSEQKRLISDTLGRLQEVYDGIDRDLKQARSVQQSLVPDTCRRFDGAEVSLLLKPCGHIGGDLVGMFSPGPGQIGFYSIDVSGHGITSAMMTARLGGYLSSTHFDQNVAVERQKNGSYALREPAEVARLLNDRLMADTGVEEYFTMAYGTMDTVTGRVQLVQAGHPHPLVIGRDGGLSFIGDGGPPIGLLPGIDYDQIDLAMTSGDRLLLYSDGFTECAVAAGGMLDEDGLARLVGALCGRSSGEEFLGDLYWSLAEGLPAGGAFDDDVSATLLDYLG